MRKILRTGRCSLVPLLVNGYWQNASSFEKGISNRPMKVYNYFGSQRQSAIGAN